MKMGPTGAPSFAKRTVGVFLTATTLAFVLTVFSSPLTQHVLAAASGAKIQLTTTNAGPREVEETTAQAIARDYAKAWQSMNAAREQNRPDLLANMFVGYAQDNLMQAIKAQRTANLRTRIVDHGHKLEAVFYSQEGSALQLRDTAQLTMQILDGDSVVHTEDATIHYLVTMTPTADHWQVRALQAVPAF
jgi:hypothetical protein